MPVSLNRPQRNTCGSIMTGMNWIIWNSLDARVDISMPSVRAQRAVSRFTSSTSRILPCMIMPSTYTTKRLTIIVCIMARLPNPST